MKGTDIQQVAFIYLFVCDSVHELENKTVFTSPVSLLPTCSVFKLVPKSLVIYMDFEWLLATFQSSEH